MIFVFARKPQQELYFPFVFFFKCYGDHRDLHNNRHSFPTRRSSDLTPARATIRVTSLPGGNSIEFTGVRSEEHTSELQSPVVISYAVFCLNKNTSSVADPGLAPVADRSVPFDFRKHALAHPLPSDRF